MIINRLVIIIIIIIINIYKKIIKANLKYEQIL